MRIFVIGQAAFGQDVFNKLREAGEEIVGVAAPAQSLSGRADRLSAAAAQAGVPAFELASLRQSPAQGEIAALAPDLGVMAFVSELIPLEMLNLPKYGTIQYHPSLLPKHRGRSAINWAVIQGDTTTGVSIFWPDEGLDTGPILLQREVEIGPDDTTGSLYYDKLYPLGIEMFIDAVQLVAEGKASRTPQDESQMTYDKPCTDATVRVDWREPAQSVYNLIRGADPSPGAWTRFDGQKVKLLDARLTGPMPAPPGTIESISGDGVVVAGNGGSLTMRKFQTDAGALPAHEVAAALGMSQGARFTNPRKG